MISLNFYKAWKNIGVNSMLKYYVLTDEDDCVEGPFKLKDAIKSQDYYLDLGRPAKILKLVIGEDRKEVK